MGNKDKKAVKPFVVNLNLDMAGLDGVPESTKNIEIAGNWIQRGIMVKGDASRGFSIQNHLKFRDIRRKVEEAVKSNALTVSFEPEEFKFIKSCWDDAGTLFEPRANEVVCRVYDILRDAQSRHDREDVELHAEDPVSSQDVGKPEPSESEEAPELFPQ